MIKTAAYSTAVDASFVETLSGSLLAVTLVSALLSPIGADAQSAGASANQSSAEVAYSVDGLKEPAEILVDRWGVPHIFANNQDDLFFSQGFNAARDRLWQLDLWKRRGDGTLSEAFGEGHLAQDRAARLLLFRGEMYREWLAYASDTKRIVTSFVQGINAYIDLTEKQPQLLPPEFQLLDYRPARWTPETVVRIRSHGLLRNLRGEIARAKFLAEHGADAAHFRDWLEPEHRFTIPEGLDLEDLRDPAILDQYGLGTATVPVAELGSPAQRVAELANPTDQFSEGSNNWALSPSRTTTGRAMLADDPHRTQAVPSLRYIAHLSSPGLDIIGAGEPALPGVSIGHNGTIAFGLTIFSIDQEDLYVYETDPENPRRYRYKGDWRTMDVVEESVPVRVERGSNRGLEQRPVTLLFSHHGPILHEDPENHRAFALRAAWLEPGMAPYLGSIEYMRARNWDQFLAAMNRWGAPSENQVYADTAGNIGWKPGGLAPIRDNWDGLLPVPGDGRYEWQGYHDADQLPVEFNPTRGWVATANQMNLPDGYDNELGYEWASPYRFQRIAEVLSLERKFSIPDLLELQTDYQSQPARRLLTVLETLNAQDEITGDAARPFRILADWDGNLEVESAAAALFEIWWSRHLPGAIVEVSAGEDRSLLGATADLAAQASRERLLRICERLVAGKQPEIGQAVIDSLTAAFAEGKELLGDDSYSWRWGDLHQIELEHPLAADLPDDFRRLARVGPQARGGSGDTVGSTRYNPETFRQTSGASFRLVVDVGNWDGSIAMNSPGQSGIPGHRHYDDLFELWASDQAFPLLYSRSAIEQATEQRFRLEPASASRP